jgi:hypothetical protein
VHTLEAAVHNLETAQDVKVDDRLFIIMLIL